MNIALWIVAGLLAAAMFGSGLMKVAQPREKLIKSGMGWAEDFPAGAVKLIGALEMLGALGLILPALLDIAPILVPVAATGLAITMAGAVIVHLRRKEYSAIAPAAVFLLMALFIAWGRFGPYSF